MDGSHEPPLDFGHVTIGVLTALEEEYAACLGIFDPEGNGADEEKRATSGNLVCRICRVPARHGGAHVVAITRLPKMGNNAAAIAANILLQHCTSIEALIMCGIAGAVPHPSKHEHHVRLGDIVVSANQGIIQYDMGKQRNPHGKDAPFAGFEPRMAPQPPCPRLMDAVARINSEARLLGRNDARDWEQKIGSFLCRYANAPEWKRPRPSKDKLADATECPGPAARHPRDPARRSGHPRVFQGAIGSANIVLADTARRDELRDRYGIRAVEMEGAGVADASWIANIGYLVVRGTCDYCSSAKNDSWHSYAALIAAAYTRTIIEHLHCQPPGPLDRIAANPNVRPGGEAISLQAQVGPPKLDAAALAGEFAGSQSVPTRYQAKSSTFVDSPVSEMSAVSAAADAIADAIRDGSRSSDHHSHIRQLTEHINTLLESGRWRESAFVEDELERLLRLSDRTGKEVRDGWLSLARLEFARLQAEKASGRTIDVARLRQCREEAERVTD